MCCRRLAPMAEAICEAVRRPTMRFVQVKSAEQQGQLMQHRTRDLLIRQRTQSINAFRAHLAELGIVAAKGDAGVTELLAIVADEQVHAVADRCAGERHRAFSKLRRPIGATVGEQRPGDASHLVGASATATTLKGRRASSCVSQGYFPGFCWAPPQHGMRADDPMRRM